MKKKISVFHFKSSKDKLTKNLNFQQIQERRNQFNKISNFVSVRKCIKLISRFFIFQWTIIITLNKGNKMHNREENLKQRHVLSENNQQRLEKSMQNHVIHFRKPKQQLYQTTIGINNSALFQVQTFSASKIPQNTIKYQVSCKLSKVQQAIRNSSYLVEFVNHYIYEIADRNQAFDANYAHFLALLYLTLQQIALTIYESQNLKQVKKHIFVKLQKENIKKQLNETTYYDFMTFILRKQKLSAKLIRQFMRNFMIREREACIAVFPYYFNMFAMVINKEIIFNEQPDQQLIPYTFEIIHQKRYDGKFLRQEVFAQMRRVQKLSIAKYHCQQL